jgi:hypothetical protein
VAHALVARLSIAQALVWLDAAAALAAVEELTPLVGTLYPGYVSKLEETDAAARRALGLHLARV